MNTAAAKCIPLLIFYKLAMMSLLAEGRVGPKPNFFSVDVYFAGKKTSTEKNPTFSL